MKQVKDILAHNLKYYRQELGLTQSDTAEKAKMSGRQYQKLEAGGSNATLDTLNNVARAFQVTIDQLLRLSFSRTALSRNAFLEKYKAKFDEQKIGAGIRDLNGVVLWGNSHTEKLQGRIHNYSKEPLD